MAPSVRVLTTGELAGETPEAQGRIREFDLNRANYVRFRRMWIEIVELAAACNPALYRRLMGFPDDLPDLSALRPPDGNSRPERIAESHFARRQRGELPDTH